jgi:hypothetical protein
VEEEALPVGNSRLHLLRFVRWLWTAISPALFDSRCSFIRSRRRSLSCIAALAAATATSTKILIKTSKAQVARPVLDERVASSRQVRDRQSSRQQMRGAGTGRLQIETILAC